MTHDDNRIEEVRPTSTFDTFDPNTTAQGLALQLMIGLSGRLLDLSDEIHKTDLPFHHGHLHILSGPVGIGKTHLMEALVNSMTPEVRDRTFWTSKNAVHASSSNYLFLPKECCILLLDDWMNEYPDTSRWCEGNEINATKALIETAYRRRLLVVLTTNLNVTTDAMGRVAGYDQKGRYTSRYAELLKRGFDLALDGTDFRGEAPRRGKNQLRVELTAGGGTRTLPAVEPWNTPNHTTPEPWRSQNGPTETRSARMASPTSSTPSG